MLADEYEAWVAQIDLTDSVEGCAELLKIFRAMDPVMPMLVDAALKRLRSLRGGVSGHDPWNHPMSVGTHIMPPLSHRYGK